MNKILTSLGILIVALVALIFVVQTHAAVTGTAGVGDECNVNAPDASHTCSNGLVCVPQNDDSEGNGKCASTVTPTVTPTPTPVCEGEDCPTATPTPTVTPTNTPNNPGGPGDGRSDNLGCGSHDCSNHSSGQVLGASTQAVLGLSATSSGSNVFVTLVQLIAALGLAATGLRFFKKNA